MFSQKRVILQDGCNILGKNSRVQLTVGVRDGERGELRVACVTILSTLTEQS